MARVEIDQAGLAALTTVAAGVDLDRRAARILEAQVAACPVKTGRLRGSLGVEVSVDRQGGPVRRVGSNVHYAIHVEEGTGLFGKHNHVIVPKTKKALFWKGAAHPVASVKGSPAQPFIAPAIAAGAD